MGQGGPANPDQPPPAAEKVDEAVNEQKDLLAEFDKIAEELNRVLANLEGSTLVKRLKAASRTQGKIGGRMYIAKPLNVKGVIGVIERMLGK